MTFTLSENFVLTIKATRDVVPAEGGNSAVARINNSIGTTFEIKDTKFYVPVVTLLIVTENDNKLLQVLDIIQIIKKIIKNYY